MHNKIHQVLGTNGTTQPEWYLFLGIAMGVHMLPFLADYWSSDPLLGVPGISAGMPINQFKALLRCFYLNNKNKAVPHNQPGHDQLHKIRPMIKCLRETWRSCYHPPRGQSIDEAMVGFKGRNAMKQYVHAQENLPNVATRCGVGVLQMG